ncbi:hypothetical protein AMECASPLE_034922 [Ameca splendens]|uniref:Uncharacterized protein n=1 Tax=Ameca splendens TaxID=208324 RepID=A0ABV0YIM8_9TELE
MDANFVYFLLVEFLTRTLTKDTRSRLSDTRQRTSQGAGRRWMHHSYREKIRRTGLPLSNHLPLRILSPLPF